MATSHGCHACLSGFCSFAARLFLVVSLPERLGSLHSCAAAAQAGGPALTGICPLVSPSILEVSLPGPNDSTLLKDFR